MFEVTLMSEFSHILVPTDFGASAARALDIAVELSQKLGASLTLLHAYEIPMALDTYQDAPPIPAEYSEFTRQAAQRRLDEALTELQKRAPNARALLKYGVPWQQILEAVDEEHPSVVVMGTHGRRGLKHVLLGSVAEKVVRLSPVPVLTARAPET